VSADPREIPEYPTDDAERDGIGEEDNAIPLWYNASFAGTVVFAVVYALFYLFSGWSARGQWREELAVAEQRYAAVRAAAPTANPYHGNAAALAEGAQVFATICAACHLLNGSGLVGPSLVDPYWKYGRDDAELYRSVSEGRPGGMPAWGAQLGADKIWKALAYVETLPRSEQPGVGAPGYVPPAAPPGGS
jgi:cytochrome c oxidase cbb3-type subunit 3